MSDVDTVWDYARFPAAQEIITNVSSATDVRLIDVTHAAVAGGTDPFVTWPMVELQSGSFLETLRIAEDVLSTSSTAFDIFIRKEGEAKIFAGMGDFAALDDLRTPEGQIRRQIRGLPGTPRLTYRERLTRRLEFLVETMKEEEEAWNEDSSESLRMMLLFLQTIPSFRCPTVTVTPSATFRAEWTVDPSRHFAVDFLLDGQVRFVVFCPDPRYPDRVQRGSGITSRENLINVVEPYKVQRWAADAGT